MDEHYLDYTEEHERFARHIEPDDNRHIFFSGKYGVGKSTFIRKFFEKHKDEYYSVFLTPVDYVVSSNENIFELIKADIIRHLFQDEILEKYQKSLIEKTAAIIKATGHKAHKIAPVLIGLLNKLHPVSPYSLIDSTALGKMVDMAIEIDEDVKKSLKDVADKLDDYGLALTEKEGTHLEFNTISELIKETILSNKKETVLIIDDLDRLDPEHIFRLLNIFSAHHNKQSNTNKFGFDKVILIGDYTNIEFIYHHRYGEQVDFKGYIDKYYSREVFQFDFHPVFRQFIEQKVGSKLPDYAKQFLNWFVFYLIDNNEIRFRDIIRSLSDRPFSNKQLILSTKIPDDLLKTIFLKEENDHIINIYSENLPLLGIIEILCIAYGGLDNFITRLNKLIEYINKNASFSEDIAILYFKAAATTLKFITQQKNQHLILGKHYNDENHLTSAGDVKLDSNHIIIINWTFKRNEYSSKSCFYAHSSIDVKLKNTNFRNEIYEVNLLKSLLFITHRLKPILSKFGLG